MVSAIIGELIFVPALLALNCKVACTVRTPTSCPPSISRRSRGTTPPALTAFARNEVGPTARSPQMARCISERPTEPGAVDVLVTRPASGTLTLDGEALDLKTAKPLPASD